MTTAPQDSIIMIKSVSLFNLLFEIRPESQSGVRSDCPGGHIGRPYIFQAELRG